MPFPRAALLDLDGTLLDSAPGILATYRATLAELGHTPDPAQDLRHVIGPPLGDVLPTVLAHYGDTRTDLALQTYRRIYGETGIFGAAPFPGIPAMLDALLAAGQRLFIATAKRADFAERMMHHLGLYRHFAGIYGALPGGGLDEKPELIAHILKREGLRPGDATMAGDRRYDISGAHANKLRAVGVLWGYGTRQELEEAGADALAATPAELASVLTA